MLGERSNLPPAFPYNVTRRHHELKSGSQAEWQCGDCRFAGKITLGEGSGLLRTTIKDLVTAGHKAILLNLQDVSYLDSAGLGEMVGSYATVTNQGGHVKLLNVQSKVHDLLQITKLYTVFATY